MVRHVSRGAAAPLLAGGAASALLLAAAPVAAQTADVRTAPVQAGAAPLAPGAGALIIDQDRLDRQLPAPAPAAPPTVAPPGSTGPLPAAPATALRRLKLEGSTRLAGEADRIAAPFLGKPLDAARVRAVADAVSAAYARTGLALYTVVAPAQDLSGGVLTLRAVEGHIEQVVITGPTPTSRNRLIQAYAARIARERPLTRATLERYLSLIRDIPGVTLDAQLVNGTTPGGVRLMLKVTQKRVQHDISFNTRGTPRLGAAQVQASLIGNSLLRQGDQARATVSLPTQPSRFQYGALGYSTVLNASGLTALANVSYLRTRPKTPPIDGKAFAAGLQLSYPAIRGYRESLYLSGGIDLLNSDNAAYGVQISSDHVRTLRAGLSWVRAEPRRSLSLLVSASAGLDGLGAHVDTRLSDPDFRKLVVQASAAQLLGKRLALRLRAMAQLSDKRLPSAEQAPLGGEPFGRAFSSALVTGDRAYAGSAELGWTPPIKGRLAGSEAYGFVDAGVAWLRDRLPYVAPTRYDLASAGGGVRVAIGRTLVIGLEAAKALDAPYPGGARPWRAVISWRSFR